jgi:hypothetical protein
MLDAQFTRQKDSHAGAHCWKTSVMTCPVLASHQTQPSSVAASRTLSGQA